MTVGSRGFRDVSSVSFDDVMFVFEVSGCRDSW